MKMRAGKQLRGCAATAGQLALAMGLALAPFSAVMAAENAPESAASVTPREFFNDGTRKLREGRLPEAEALLESALASQDERLQPATLYNLGHVRFDRGAEELKKGPAAESAIARGRAAMQQGGQAIRDANAALAGDDLEKIVDSYVRGRGARKELKAATEAVKRALEAHRATLTQWERSSGDFKSTAELKNGRDGDAQFNAEVVDRCIAKLVDSIRQLQETMGAMGNMSKELGDKLKQLRGRIPDKDAPPGSGGEDDDEDEPFGQKQGQKEGASREGQQMTFSPEQAGWLLDGYKLDGDRRLPMGQNELGEPQKRNGRTW